MRIQSTQRPSGGSLFALIGILIAFFLLCFLVASGLAGLWISPIR